LLGRLHFQSHIDLVHLVLYFIDLAKTTPTNLLQLNRKGKLGMNDRDIKKKKKKTLLFRKEKCVVGKIFNCFWKPLIFIAHQDCTYLIKKYSNIVKYYHLIIRFLIDFKI